MTSSIAELDRVHFRPPGMALGGVLILTLLVRTGVLLSLPGGLDRDTDSYRAIAETVRGYGVFGYQDHSTGEVRGTPTAFRPPLYPLLLALFVWQGELAPAAVGGINLACGILTVGLVWDVGRKWGLNRLMAAVAAALTACDPILVNQSAQIMTETMATLAAVAALWGITVLVTEPSVRSALVAGVLLGLASLCRPTFLPWAGLVVLVCGLTMGHTAARWRPLTALVAALVCTLLPWGARNYLQFGHWKFTTTHGGFTLLLGNNPAYYRFLRDTGGSQAWDSDELRRAWIDRAWIVDARDDLFHPPPAGPARDASSDQVGRVTRSEFDDDQLAYALALRYIREDPGQFLNATMHRVWSLWRLVPRRVSDPESAATRLLRGLTGVWYVLLFGGALVGAFRWRTRLLQPPWVLAGLLMLVFTAVHSLYWSDMRMRAPLMPIAALFAAAAVRQQDRRSGASDLQS